MSDLFDELALQAIKSMSQRSLATYWNTLARDKRLPPFSDFQPPPRLHDPKQLLIWNVAAGVSRHNFRAMFLGSHVAEVFGNGQGLPVESVVPKQLQSVMLQGLNECATTKGMIYMIVSARDASGNDIDCERLLLPFGRTPDRVEQIIASLQLISPTGHFERSTVLQQFLSDITIKLAGRIT